MGVSDSPTGESSYKGYDFLGNLVSETDYNGNTTLYTYNIRRVIGRW